MSYGIEKEVDNLGRIVIPVKFRNHLGIKSWDKVLISLQNNTISIVLTTSQCALCGNTAYAKHGVRLCDACIESIKKIP